MNYLTEDGKKLFLKQDILGKFVLNTKEELLNIINCDKMPENKITQIIGKYCKYPEKKKEILTIN
jgi:hypothetical protein